MVCERYKQHALCTHRDIFLCTHTLCLHASSFHSQLSLSQTDSLSLSDRLSLSLSLSLSLHTHTRSLSLSLSLFLSLSLSFSLSLSHQGGQALSAAGFDVYGAVGSRENQAHILKRTLYSDFTYDMY